MADITYSVSMRVDKGNFANQVNVSNVTATMSEVGMKCQTLTVSTNAVSISTAGLSSVGMAFMRNLSTATASVVTVGIEEGGSFVGLASLRAGEPAVFRLASGTNYKAVGTAGSRLRVDITEG